MASSRPAKISCRTLLIPPYSPAGGRYLLFPRRRISRRLSHRPPFDPHWYRRCENISDLFKPSLWSEVLDDRTFYLGIIESGVEHRALPI